MGSLAELRSRLESIWADVDDVLSSLDGADWTRRHGPHWTFRDIPFHLSYFDDEMIAEPIEQGTDATADMVVFETISELNAWNDAHLADRPLDMSPAELVADMHRSRQRIRDAVDQLDDDNLGDAVLLRLPGTGWSNLQAALHLAEVHAWNHCVEAKLRLGRSEPTPDPTVTHTALHSLVSSMPIVLDRSAARAPLVTQIRIGGPGGGDWTIDVADGRCTVVEESPSAPDLTMRYRDAEAFAAGAFRVTHPMRLMVTGRMRVNGMSKMGRFAKLFPTSPPD